MCLCKVVCEKKQKCKKLCYILLLTLTIESVARTRVCECVHTCAQVDLFTSVECYFVYVWFLHSRVHHCHVSPGAPAVTILTQIQTRTHTQRRNESCWEVELRSIRVTTYLQTVGGESCLAVTHQPSGTLALLTPGLPASPNCTVKCEGGTERRDGAKRGGKWQGVDQMKKCTHIHASYMCVGSCMINHICVHTNARANEISPFIYSNWTCLMSENKN